MVYMCDWFLPLFDKRGLFVVEPVPWTIFEDNLNVLGRVWVCIIAVAVFGLECVCCFDEHVLLGKLL
jgi:hypothetical protein